MLTLNKNKNKHKTPLGETGYLGIFLRPLPCVTGTPPQLLRSVRVSTSSELYPDTGFFWMPRYFCCTYSHLSLLTHFKMYVVTQILHMICYFCCKYSHQSLLTHFKMYIVTQILHMICYFCFTYSLQNLVIYFYFN